jgi:hypothetical protein
VAKIGRNDPCPCGSARKYKLCHGAVAIVAAPAAQAAATTPGATGTRHCGACTACCEGWAEGEIRGQRMFPGRHCHFLQRGREPSPCTIYDERPQSPCRNFVCGWLAPGSPFPDDFRPDRVGVILVPTRWREQPAWILLSAGQDPGPEMLTWMQAHARTTGQPFYYARNGERLGYGPAAFQQDMLDKLQRGEKLW